MQTQKQIKQDTNRQRSFFQDFIGLKRLWPFLVPNKRFVIAAALLIPLISILQTSLPLLLKKAIDEGVLKKDLDYLWLIAGIYLVAVIGEYGARATQTVLSSIAVHRMILNMRGKLVRHVMALSSRFHDKSLSGALVTRTTSDFDNLSESLNMGVLTSIIDLAVLCGCIVGMFLLDWQLALIATLILPLVFFIVRWFSSALKRAMLDARRRIAALNAYTQECFYGQSTVKLLRAKQPVQKQYDSLNVAYRDAQMKSVILDSVMFSLLEGVASITVGFVLWIGVTQLLDNRTLSVGVFIAFVAYIQQLFEPLKQLGNKIAMLQGAFTSLDRIFGLFAENDFIGGKIPVTAVRGHIIFEHVTFRYQKSSVAAQTKDSPVLDDVSFELPAGQSLALVGATGSGKSTIIKLVTKLYDLYEGSITLDGKNLSDLSPASIREHIAIVPQDIVIFDGSVEFNITLGAPQITRAQVMAAAQSVGADRFITRLPGGYDYLLRENGSNLSQGQRQLIAFARALVRNPQILVLDEATSSVDPESEEQIQQATQKLLHGRTVIVIAHRLSTIKQCDQIILLERGRIIERGNHQELLDQAQAYFRLHSGSVLQESGVS